MPLVQSILKQTIQSIQSAQPSSLVQSAQLWSNAIFSYSASGLAGVLSPLPSLTQVALQALFLKSMTAKSFMNDLGNNLQQWWTPVVWLGTGFTRHYSHRSTP